MATAYHTLTDTEQVLSEKLLGQARAADEWECYRHPHAARIAAIADSLARKFNLARQDRSALRLAAYAHDLGIMVMQRDYIGRNSPLSLEERLDLARHPIIGEQEAMRLGTPRAVQLIVRWHHEAWNGSGYPDALQREQIPLSARILHVADAYASLTDERPFRPASTEEDALRIIAEGAGIDFDPAVVQTLFMLEDIPELRSYISKLTPVESPLTEAPQVVIESHIVAASEPILFPEPSTAFTEPPGDGVPSADVIPDSAEPGEKDSDHTETASQQGQVDNINANQPEPEPAVTVSHEQSTEITGIGETGFASLCNETTELAPAELQSHPPYYEPPHWTHGPAQEPEVVADNSDQPVPESVIDTKVEEQNQANPDLGAGHLWS